MTSKQGDRIIELLEGILKGVGGVVPAKGLSARVLRECKPRIRAAKIACYNRGWKPEEIERMYDMEILQGPAYAELLEYLATGRKITDARRARRPALTDPHEMRQATIAADGPWEGVV